MRFSSYTAGSYDYFPPSHVITRAQNAVDKKDPRALASTKFFRDELTNRKIHLGDPLELLSVYARVVWHESTDETCWPQNDLWTLGVIVYVSSSPSICLHSPHYSSLCSGMR